jgi:hypothetical protein
MRWWGHQQLLKVPETGKVLDGPELGTTAIDTLVNVAHTITGVIPSGHVLSSEALSGWVVKLKTALPPSTLTVWVSVTVIAVLCRPLGSLLPEGVAQPVVTIAVATNDAVAV